MGWSLQRRKVGLETDGTLNYQINKLINIHTVTLYEVSIDFSPGTLLLGLVRVCVCIGGLAAEQTLLEIWRGLRNEYCLP